MKRKVHRVLVGFGVLAALWMPNCTRYCTAMVFCTKTVDFQFVPPIRASDLVTMTITGDNLDLAGSYSSNHEIGLSSISLRADNTDGGGIVITSADLDTEMPKHISYVVVADGVTVASGEVDLQYQHYTRGGEDCKQQCTTAYVTVPVTQ